MHIQTFAKIQKLIYIGFILSITYIFKLNHTCEDVMSDIPAINDSRSIINYKLLANEIYNIVK